MLPAFITIGINDAGDALAIIIRHATFTQELPDMPLAGKAALGFDTATQQLGATVLGLLEMLHPGVFMQYPALKSPPTDYTRLPHIDLDTP